MPTRPRKLNWTAIGRVVFGLIVTIFTGAIAGAWRVRSDMASETERVIKVEESAKVNADKLKATSDTIAEHMVPREEHQQRWNMEDQMRKQQIDNEERHFADIVHRMDDLKQDVRDIKSEIKNQGVAKADK